MDIGKPLSSSSNAAEEGRQRPQFSRNEDLPRDQFETRNPESRRAQTGGCVFLPDYKSWAYIEKHPGSYEKSVVLRMRNALESHGVRRSTW
jgi:hypothetical protein